jgi:DNA-binding CsgD family transcriptional regulator
MVVGALRRSLKLQMERDLHSIPNLCVRARSGRWLTLQASLTEPQDDRLPETVVIISPAGPKQVVELHTAAYGLSPREKEVFDLAVRGYSTREISSALYISESTVQGHLSLIFEKVGVRSRRDLLKRLFFDSLPPGP